jgi:bacteriocin biosynthesis cyclodehydratase domain-containing protein
MLAPGQRMIDRPGVLHFYDGRQVVSIGTDEVLGQAIRFLANRSFEDMDLPALASQVGLDLESTSRLIETLSSLGLVESGQRSMPSAPPHGGAAQLAAANFCSGLTGGWVSTGESHARLAQATAHVLGPDAAALSLVLEASGIRAAQPHAVAELAVLDPAADVVVATMGGGQSAKMMTEINDVCLDRGLTLLPIGSYDGAVLRVGPLIVAGQTACFECTITRLSANVDFAQLYRDVVLLAPPAPAPAAVRDWAFSVAALILVQWIGAREASIPGTIHTLVPATMSDRVAKVLRVPRCQGCGAPDFLPAAAPWEAPDGG